MNNSIITVKSYKKILSIIIRILTVFLTVFLFGCQKNVANDSQKANGSQSYSDNQVDSDNNPFDDNNTNNSTDVSKDPSDNMQDDVLTSGNAPDIQNVTNQNDDENTDSDLTDDIGSTGQTTDEDIPEDVVYRDNTPVVLNPVSSGTVVYGNESVSVDAGNCAEGYITVQYLGNNAKVKFQITGPDKVTYTYDINSDVAVIPLTAGSGNYSIGCYENVSSDQYAIAYTGSFDVSITNVFGPYLYPNQYVNFNAGSQTVSQASQIVAGCTSDLAAVEAIYSYVVDNISYDYNKAANVSSGYLPVVDNTLSTKTGICFDYAVLMAAMLRSQGIPTRLEIGYAGSAYHSWISTYIDDVGWVDGIIYFDGKNWVLMDPTFAANSDRTAFEEFIGDGSNYVTVYKY